MTAGGGHLRLATCVVGLAVLCVGLVAFAPTAAAQESDSYVVQQGEECIEVDPITDENSTVEEFYDYRNEDTEPSSDSYSSFGTVEYQEDNTSHLMIYEGSDGASLVVVHERYHQDASEGSRGGNAGLTFSGLPSDSEWAVKDDQYDGQSDEYEDSGSTKSAEWWYDQSRTDGAVIRGIGGADAITVEPAFNENTWSGSYGGLIHDWKVITSAEDGIERASLNMSQSITVSPGICGEGDANGPDADLEAPGETEVDETVTLDASGSETGPDPTYEWFIDGEAVDAEGPTHETSFSEPGTHDLRVEVTDENGTGTAEATIEVYDGPSAAFAVRPSSPEAEERITFDGNESTGDVVQYEWDFGNGVTAEGETATNAYEEAGTYEVRLTVTDESGRQDTTTQTVEVTEPPGPNASLSAPETATTDETVTLDASGSETGPNPTYEWFVDKERVPDADGPTLDTSFSDPGSHRVRVKVTDDGGTDSVGQIIEVRGQVEANADAVPRTVETGESITFDGADSSGDIESYRWNFGDGTTGTGITPSHTYEDSGTYLVELVVETTDGRTARDTVEVTVEEPPESSGGTTGDSEDDENTGGDDGSETDENRNGDTKNVTVDNSDGENDTETSEDQDGDTETGDNPVGENDTETGKNQGGESDNGTDENQSGESQSETDENQNGDTETDDDGAGFGAPTALFAGLLAVLVGRRRLR